MTPDGTRLLADFSRLYFNYPSHVLWRTVEVAVVRRLGPYEPPILDLGCGDGQLVRIAFSEQLPLEAGIDLEERDVERARRRGVYQRVEVGDIRSLPYNDGTFATVFSNSVLEHVEGVQKVLQEVSRVLRPGGRFVFTVPTPELVWTLPSIKRFLQRDDRDTAMKRVEEFNRTYGHATLADLATWTGWLRIAGLSVTRSHEYLSEKTIAFYERLLTLQSAVRATIPSVRRQLQTVYEEVHYERHHQPPMLVPFFLRTILRRRVYQDANEPGVGGVAIVAEKA